MTTLTYLARGAVLAVVLGLLWLTIQMAHATNVLVDHEQPIATVAVVGQANTTGGVQ